MVVHTSKNKGMDRETLHPDPDHFGSGHVVASLAQAHHVQGGKQYSTIEWWAALVDRQ